MQAWVADAARADGIPVEVRCKVREKVHAPQEIRRTPLRVRSEEERRTLVSEGRRILVPDEHNADLERDNLALGKRRKLAEGYRTPAEVRHTAVEEEHRTQVEVRRKQEHRTTAEVRRTKVAAKRRSLEVRTRRREERRSSPVEGWYKERSRLREVDSTT